MLLRNQAKQGQFDYPLRSSARALLRGSQAGSHINVYCKNHAADRTTVCAGPEW